MPAAPFDLFINIIKIGFGMDIVFDNPLNPDDPDNICFISDFFAAELMFKHNRTNLGVQYDLAKFNINWFSDVHKNTGNAYFFNPTIFWEPINIYNLHFGLFASLNYLKLTIPSNSSEIKFSVIDYVFSAGIRLMWESGWSFFSPIPLGALGLETGYRLNSGNSSFYFLFTFGSPFPKIRL
ncbi:hypothetical protein FACS189494_08250 [Spirochaetia bacterium]|nr:hypothetical protein FACS189494_08250 [Spirochaetia bacterium]